MWSVIGATVGGLAITGRSPASAKVDHSLVQQNITLTVDGSGFPADPMVWLYWRKQPVIKATAVSVNAAGTRLTCEVDIGGWDPSGTSGSISMAIAVISTATGTGAVSSKKFTIKD
jgi:hypothetical protein